jgi:hypothetical protein
MGLSIMNITMELPDNIRAYFQEQGKIGAAKRQRVISPERRSEIARKAAITRWARQVKETPAKEGPTKKGTK